MGFYYVEALFSPEVKNMYKNMRKQRGWMDQLEPPWPIIAMEDNEPKNQIGESVVVAVKNLVLHRNTLNRPDEKRYVNFGAPQIITSDLLKTGAQHTNKIKSRRNNPGFLDVGDSWR